MTLPTLRTLTVHADDRGNVREAYRASWFPEVPPIKQIVRSKSRPATLRGMHAHKRQFDIWHVVEGSMLVQTYDHRSGEHWAGELDAGSTLVIPPGVSHGFYTEEGCILTYFLTEEYDGTDEFGWWAYDLGFPGADLWPADVQHMSDRDSEARPLADFAAAW